jgi:hypothetical protein
LRSWWRRASSKSADQLAEQQATACRRLAWLATGAAHGRRLRAPPSGWRLEGGKAAGGSQVHCSLHDRPGLALKLAHCWRVPARSADGCLGSRQLPAACCQRAFLEVKRRHSLVHDSSTRV